MISKRVVVISGMGAITGFGAGVATLWDAVAAGGSCISSKELPGQTVERMAALAGREAFSSAGIGSPADAELVMGTNVGRVRFLSELGINDLNAFLSPDTLGHWADHGALAADVAAELGCNVEKARALTGACASGMLALGYAYDQVALGRCRVALAGGADEQTEFKASGHHALGSASASEYVRPFDAERDGTVFRSGAGFVVLEDLEACLVRGHRPWAILAGYGIGSDTGSLTAPDAEGKGMICAMQAALADSNLGPHSIDHIQAHATGTRLNDAIEAGAIRKVFGQREETMTVSGDKGAIGHTFGASGVLSVILAVLMMGKKMVLPVVGCMNPDLECTLPLVLGNARESEITAALCNNFGFGGCNAAVIVKAYRDKHHLGKS